MADKITYKITGILTLYEVTKSDTYVSINGDIKSPDGRNLFFKCDKDGNYKKTKNSVKAYKVNKHLIIPNKLEHVISLIFSDKQKATFIVDDSCKKIEGVEIKQP